MDQDIEAVREKLYAIKHDPANPQHIQTTADYAIDALDRLTRERDGRDEIIGALLDQLEKAEAKAERLTKERDEARARS